MDYDRSAATSVTLPLAVMDDERDFTPLPTSSTDVNTLATGNPDNIMIVPRRHYDDASSSALLVLLKYNYFRCPACQRELRDPKILSCLHTFCASCLEEDLARTNNGSTFMCPVCRMEMKSPIGGVKGIRDNIFIKALLEEIGLVTGDRQVCENCDLDSLASHICFHCGTVFCDDCIDAHQKVKAFIGHGVVTLLELATDAGHMTRYQSRRYPLCDRHEDLMKLFCKECSSPVCHNCMQLSEHRGHYAIDLVQEIENQREPIRLKFLSMRGLKLKVQENVRSIQAVIGKVDQIDGDVTRQINIRKVKLMNAIEQYASDLERELGNESHSWKEKLTLDLRRSQDDMQALRLLGDQERVLNEIPVRNVLRVTYDLLDQLDQRSKINRDITLPAASYFTSRQPNSMATRKRLFVCGEDPGLITATFHDVFGFVYNPLRKRNERRVQIFRSHMSEVMEKFVLQSAHNALDVHGHVTRNDVVYNKMAETVKDLVTKEYFEERWNVMVGTRGEITLFLKTPQYVVIFSSPEGSLAVDEYKKLTHLQR